MTPSIAPPSIQGRASHAAALALAFFAAAPAAAQEKFPSKPIEVVTHAGVGGGTDLTARMMMVQAPAALGTELVVVNKTGGSGAAALGYAESRPKDGHTIILITQTHLLTMMQGRGGGLKPADLVPLARATDDPQIVMVGKSSPHRDAKAYLEAGKTKAFKFGTTQIGSIDHLAVVGFAKHAGLQKPTVVPFRGGGDIVINLVGGNIDAGLLNFAEAESQIKAGEVRPLLVLAAERLPNLPDVPTAKELGVPAEFSTVRGFAVLKGTPPERVKVLEEGLVKAMSGDLYRNYLTTSGQSPKSVVGREAWAAQLDAYVQSGGEALASLGLTAK